MGNPRGFIDIKRLEAGYRPVHDRVADYGEVEQTLNDSDRMLQASRCMDCGIPFCNWSCPLGNVMPEWQDALYKGRWRSAAEILLSTNNFPEFTGRICPAPCEKSCVLNIHGEPVTIRENEASIIEKAFSMGLIHPSPPAIRSGRRVAVIGSGPAGLACADMLNRKGHMVTVFEKDVQPGGLLRFGIPDFKLNKEIIERRLDLLRAEGVEFRTGVLAGRDISASELKENYDAVCIAIGSGKARDVEVPGRKLKGIRFALEFLGMQNRIVAGLQVEDKDIISAKDKHVVVIGGGDTGSDCVGTAVRHKAASVVQIEIMPEPPVKRGDDNPWPYWPNVLKTSSSHEEGCDRMWGVSARKFTGKEGILTGVEIIEVKWEHDASGKRVMTEKEGTKRVLRADLVLIAAGFTGPVSEGICESFGIEIDNRGNIKSEQSGMTSVDGIFATGDAVNGASLVVRAIASGRSVAAKIDNYLGKL